ncbi:uncharacterized protein LOC124596025 [Schistocerca americana]|uniref:uncharacterized protein LOC124596025 n=1 Tax=Schistocerca americana TaxID=7009 RepID=UPI001F5025DA|nr:uncharacterized protein LOC124596025 [Schistocerca americana]
MAEDESHRPPPPSWIDKKFVERALKNEDSKSKVRVDAATVDYAIKDGLGYMSCIFRVVATIKLDESTSYHELPLIVKCSNEEEGNLTEVGREFRVFEKEALLLCELVPDVHSALRVVEGERFSPLAARCYLFGRQPVEFLVMEDLSADGFRLAEAGQPLDYQHCVLALRAYARLHAASATLLKERPDYRERCFLPASTDLQQEFFESMADKIFKAVAREFRATAGYERYAEKYKNLSKKVVKDYNTYWESNNHMLNVVMHGDCWKNNFMFKYVGGNPTDIRILDFQFSRMHGPAGDLVYFLYANASEEVHRHHMEDLLQEYHSTLVGLLRRLGMEQQAEAYTLQEFRNEMEAAATLGVFYSAMTCLVITSEKYGADFKEFFQGDGSSDSVLENAYKNPTIMSYLKYLAPIYDKKGLL